MTLATLSALANLATLAVLVCAAVAAIVQLGRVRAGNELAAVLDLERSFADAELQNALIDVQAQLAHNLTQPAYRSELAGRGYVDPLAHPEMTVCNWFNEMGTLVAGGFLDEGVICASFGRLTEYYWTLLSPAVALLRRERGMGMYRHFELLAARAERRRRRHGEGAFPAGMARLPVVDPWAAADRGSRGVA